MTPPEIMERLVAEFGPFGRDPCPIDWKEGDADGLAMEWDDRTFVNPPYNNVGAWFRKAHEEWAKGKLVVMLTNAVTDNAVFQDLVLGTAELRFFRGRIQFIDPTRPTYRAGNVRPSMLTVFWPGRKCEIARAAMPKTPKAPKEPKAKAAKPKAGKAGTVGKKAKAKAEEAEAEPEAEAEAEPSAPSPTST